MTVIVANDVPDAIRGLLKRWFIEPRPNVFVGTVNRRTRDKVLEFVRRHAPGLGLLVIGTEKNSQGFAVTAFGETDRRPVQICGHYLIAEKWEEPEEAC
jgi:CRISPR-associated protein Cas2